jgi:HlyD family secretion protein
MRGKRLLWIVIGVVVVLLLVIIGAGRGGKGKGTAVQYAKVRYEDITAKVRAPGKIEPQTQVKISADIAGKVVHLLVKEGDKVRRGQLMLQLDDTQYRAAADQARAQLATARARVKDAGTTLKVAESNYTRQASLWKEKVLSQAEWDQATSTIESARTASSAAEQEVSRAEAAYAGASDNLAKTRFLAPFDGVVSALDVEQGEIVIIGTMNNPGTQIMTVSDLSRMLVKADVDESDVVDMKLGQKAKISVDAMPDTTFPGTVVEIGNTAKRSNLTASSEGQTNFEVKVVFDSQVPEVRPGMTADVEIETATHPNILGVPIQAVVVRTQRDLDRAAKKPGKTPGPRDAKGATITAEEDTVGRKSKEIPGVFVVRDGVAKFVPVRTGLTSDTDIEIFGDLKKDEIVVAGPYKALRELKPESKVRQEQTPGRGRGK